MSHQSPPCLSTIRPLRERAVLAWIKSCPGAEGEVVLPCGSIGLAIQYAQNQWTALTTYVTQGFLAIDNNVSEQALKRVAIGRKN